MALGSFGIINPPIEDFIALLKANEAALAADMLGTVGAALAQHGARHRYSWRVKEGSEDFAGLYRVEDAACRSLHGMEHVEGILLSLRRRSLRTPSSRKKLYATLHEFLGHELVHLEQVRRGAVRDPEFLRLSLSVCDASGKLVELHEHPKERGEYLSSWWEREAYGYSIADQLKAAGYTSWPGIAEASANSEALYEYLDEFGEGHPVVLDVVNQAQARLR